MGTRGLGQLPPPAVPCSLRVCASLGRGPGVKPGQGDGSGLSSRCCVCPRKRPAETFQPHRGCSRPRGGRRGQAHGLSPTGPAADRMAAPPQDTLRWTGGLWAPARALVRAHVTSVVAAPPFPASRVAAGCGGRAAQRGLPAQCVSAGKSRHVAQHLSLRPRWTAASSRDFPLIVSLWVCF